MQSKFRKIQSKFSQNSVKIQSKFSQNSVKIQSKFSQNAVKMQSRCSQDAVKKFTLNLIFPDFKKSKNKRISEPSTNTFSGN